VDISPFLVQFSLALLSFGFVVSAQKHEALLGELGSPLSSGLYHKHITIVNDDSSIVSK
jgi:hypothetical protein